MQFSGSQIRTLKDFLFELIIGFAIDECKNLSHKINSLEIWGSYFTFELSELGWVNLRKEDFEGFQITQTTYCIDR
jgi:hypothetical protein